MIDPLKVPQMLCANGSATGLTEFVLRLFGTYMLPKVRNNS